MLQNGWRGVYAIRWGAGRAQGFGDGIDRLSSYITFQLQTHCSDSGNLELLVFFL